MIRRIVLAASLALALGSSAVAQIGPAPGGGGGGSVTLNTTCPSSSSSGSTITLDNSLPPSAQSGDVSVSCGIGYQTTLSGSHVASIPVTSGLVAFIKNLSTSTAPLVLTPASGSIDGLTAENLWPGQMAIVWANGTNVETDLNTLPLNVGYRSGYWFGTSLDWGSAVSGAAWGTAGNIACVTYFVSPPGMTAKAIGLRVGTADTAPNYVSMAIYTNGSDGLPDAKIDDIGPTAISLATTGDKNQSVANTTDDIPPGWIWACAASNTTTGVMFGTSLVQTESTGASSIINAIGASSTGNSGIICTGDGASDCPAPAWASGAGSSYTWPASLHGATWSPQSNGSKVPAIALQAN